MSYDQYEQIRKNIEILNGNPSDYFKNHKTEMDKRVPKEETYDNENDFFAALRTTYYYENIYILKEIENHYGIMFDIDIDTRQTKPNTFGIEVEINDIFGNIENQACKDLDYNTFCNVFRDLDYLGCNPKMWYKDNINNYTYSRCNMSLGELRYFDFIDWGIENKKDIDKELMKLPNNNFLIDKDTTEESLKEWIFKNSSMGTVYLVNPNPVAKVLILKPKNEGKSINDVVVDVYWSSDSHNENMFNASLSDLCKGLDAYRKENNYETITSNKKIADNYCVTDYGETIDSFMLNDIKSFSNKVDFNDIHDIYIKYDDVNKTDNLKAYIKTQKQSNPNFENDIYVTTAYISEEEFPVDKYYLYDFQKKNGLEKIPAESVLDREYKILEGAGFVCINDYVGYENKAAFIYPNEKGKEIIENMLGKDFLEDYLYCMYNNYDIDR